MANKVEWELSQNGVVKFVGSEFDCYKELQRSQSQSAMWAMTHEGWVIKKKTYN